jgi:hypothetical protein
LEEYIASNFRVEKYAKQETSRSGRQIPPNKIARLLEGNMGKNTVVESVTFRGKYREEHCIAERNISWGI